MALSILTAPTIAAERQAQALRPTRIIYGTAEIPCVPGNHRFWESLSESTAGITVHGTMPVRVLREDLPEALNNPDGEAWSGGQSVEVHCLETNRRIKLQIGRNNLWNPVFLTLMLEAPTA